jgi:hypothetical protein
MICGAEQENIYHMRQVRSEIECSYGTRMAEQQAFVQLSADHMREECGGTIGIGQLQ